MCMYSTIIVYILQYGTLIVLKYVVYERSANCWTQLVCIKVRFMGGILWRGPWTRIRVLWDVTCFRGWFALDLSKSMFALLSSTWTQRRSTRDTSKRRMILTKGQRQTPGDSNPQEHRREVITEWIFREAIPSSRDCLIDPWRWDRQVTPKRPWKYQSATRNILE
jgi:hypothetical protein